MYAVLHRQILASGQLRDDEARHVVGPNSGGIDAGRVEKEKPQVLRSLSKQPRFEPTALLGQIVAQYLYRFKKVKVC